MKRPLVSVVIATYNMGQYLTEAVASVLAQPWDNLELIVVDDGSKDDTAQRMAAFEGDARVRYIPTENQGQPRAKNRGLKEARGDFIAFCDADDVWLENKLAVQMPFFADSKVGVVYSEVDYMDQHGATYTKLDSISRFSGNVTDQLIITNFVPFGTAIFRRACMEQNGVFDDDLPMGIDWDLWLRYSVDWQFGFAPEATYTYRIWPGQMSSNYRGRYTNAFRILNKFTKSHPDAVSPKLLARAWADMYVGRGMAIARAERAFREPMGDVMMGLWHDATYLPAWKSMAKLFLRRY